MALTAKRRKFALVYDGNGVKACKLAGFEGTDASLATEAYRLLRNAEVRALIASRELEGVALPIAERKDRQSFWTEVMNDDKASLRDRLKASELLGKSQADFTEKLEVKGELTILDLVRESYGGKKPDAPPAAPAPPKEPEL